MTVLRVLGLVVASFSATSALRSQSQMRAHAWARESCEKNLWMTMDTCLQAMDDNTTYVITGDINAMWTRDSTAQLWPYLTLLENSEAGGQEEDSLQRLRQLLHGALKRQAKFLLTDPYANAYTDKWNSEGDTRLCRGAYVFTGNFEVDSGVYFMRFLTRMAQMEVNRGPHSDGYSLLQDPTMKDAVTMLIALYRQERDHALGRSEHRYPLSAPWELPGQDGRGNEANWTGMVWGAFRPSDDPQKYAYNIPNNLFLASVLEPMSALAEQHWKESTKLVDAMRDLRKTILEGVHKYGTTASTKANTSEEVYCYEVDGLGNCLLMDDANVPSLLSLPYLDPSRTVFDEEIYGNTRKFILSTENPWYFEGQDAKGIGSPHTGPDMIWPLSLVMQAMTATSEQEKTSVVSTLCQAQAKSSAKNGLCESFNKNNASRITRVWFAWPNALLAEHLMMEKKCLPSLAELRSHLPTETTSAPVTGSPLESLQTDFYSADVQKLRRSGVVLPKQEYFPL